MRFENLTILMIYPSITAQESKQGEFRGEAPVVKPFLLPERMTKPEVGYLGYGVQDKSQKYF
jgi:hypothetical protein